MMTRTFALLGVALMLAAGPAAAQRARGAPLTASAQHVAILDGETGVLLECVDCRTPVPPASMSKLMTVLLVLEALRDGQIQPTTRYRVSPYAWREHGAPSGGSHMFLPVHSEVAVSDLLRGAVIVSANDACVVLAEGLAGSEEAFVERMNARAQALGLTTARFRNVTGVDHPEHVISTLDLARLARHLIVNFPDFYRTYREPRFTFNNRTQENRNPLLGAFDGADGVKTGHTDASGYGLVGSAVLNGQRRIIAFNGTNTMAARRGEALRLMRAAFHDYGVVKLHAAGDRVGEAQVRLGDRASVPLLARGDIVIGGPRRTLTGVTARIVYPRPLPAPVAQGAVVARLIVERPGFAPQAFALTAGQRVGRANWFARAFEGLRLTLFGP
jgi:serine-type D-Ala-D-Ala carboxypeptidase (penicillin-binding protein 5/6)